MEGVLAAWARFEDCVEGGLKAEKQIFQFCGSGEERNRIDLVAYSHVPMRARVLSDGEVTALWCWLRKEKRPVVWRIK